MSQYVCKNCGYIYDEEDGCEEVFVAEVQNELVEGFIRDEEVKCEAAGAIPGTKWKDISKEFRCPLCGSPKNQFELKND